MANRVKSYKSDEIDVTYSLKRCIHAAECVSRLSAVFDVEKRPWIQPSQAPADKIANVVEKCPTGALHHVRHDGGAKEAVPEQNVIIMRPDGPLYVSGDVTVREPNGTIMVQDTRLALCRCGMANNKPFCDNSHKKTGFSASSNVTDNQALTNASADGDPLTVTLAKNGPLILQGNFEIHSADGQSIFRGTQTALCRCGGSMSKPFCDGTHSKIGFSD